MSTVQTQARRTETARLRNRFSREAVHALHGVSLLADVQLEPVDAADAASPVPMRREITPGAGTEAGQSNAEAACSYMRRIRRQ
jgi:hypothetical protein